MALTDSDNGWAVGDNGRILRLQNGVWTVFTNTQFGVASPPRLIAVTNGANQSGEFWALGLGTGSDSNRSLILRLGS
ncbi:MAG: hypothetical protein NZ518_02795 [Dehalococcoidia bacterium]|nr:hypothetical protein [Dehalococcoidia bacterium]